MAKRGQYFSRLAQRLNHAPEELDNYLVDHGISDNEHQKLLGGRSPQLALFAEAG